MAFDAQQGWTWTWRNGLYVIGINPNFTVEAARAAVQSIAVGTGSVVTGMLVSAFLVGAFSSPGALFGYFKANIWTLIVTNIVAPYVRSVMATRTAAKSGDAPSTPAPPGSQTPKVPPPLS